MLIQMNFELMEGSEKEKASLIRGKGKEGALKNEVYGIEKGRSKGYVRMQAILIPRTRTQVCGIRYL